MTKIIMLVFFIVMACVSTQKNFASDNRQSEYDMKYELGENLLNQFLSRINPENRVGLIPYEDVILRCVIKEDILDPIGYKESVEKFMIPFNFLTHEELRIFYLKKCKPELFSISEEKFNETYFKQRAIINEKFEIIQIEYLLYLKDKQDRLQKKIDSLAC